MSSFSDFKDDLARRSQQLDEKEAENEQKLKELAESIPNLLKFDAVSSIFSDLEIVQTESKTFRNDVNKLKNLSERLNQSVSRIQSVWTRVNDCGTQIDELINLKRSSESIQEIINQGDYETAAEHVCRFLEINKIIPEPTMDAIKSDDRLQISKSIKMLNDATDQLKTLVQYKFNDAVEIMDFVAVQRFCKISFLIGMSDDGLRLLCQFMKRKLDESCQENLKFARNLSNSDRRYNLIFDEVFAMLFESIGILLEENYRLVETHFGKRKFLKIVEFLQNECDSQINEILMEFKKSRQVQNLNQNISDFLDSNSKSQQLSKIDSKELDILIDEMVLIHSRFELYFRFLRQKTTAEIENSDFNSEEKLTEIDKMNNLLKSCEANKCKADILNNYLIFEKYYLTESVNKAIDLDVLQSGQKTTSMVDDVFFLIKKCLRRAIMSNSLDAICSMTNEIGAILESNYCDLLGKRLKQGYSRSTLDTIHAYTIGKSTINLKNKQQFEELVNHIITLNNVEISIEFIDEISHNLLTKKAMKIPLYGDEENGLKTASRDFAKFKKKFEEHLEFGLQQLQVHVIRPKISSWLDPFLLVNFKMTEEELINYEAGESFVQTLIQNMDSLIALLKDSFSDKNFDKLLSLLTMELTTQLEILTRKSKFSRLGGLILDKELRQLTSYMTNIASWSIRDKFTRILQIATVLNFEQVSEIFDFHSTMSYKFSEDELKQILKLRRLSIRLTSASEKLAAFSMKMDQKGAESSEDLKRRHDEIKLRLLRKIVSLSENRQCFDCLQKGPTYVNATIGSFVCTKCSGLLRGLTPPHRVKSISMATFSVHEIELLKFRGNSYCKKVWLGLCDDNRITEPKNELEIKEFMIEKYEKKRFYLEPSPDRTVISHMNGLNKATTSPVNGVLINHINYNRNHHLSTQNLSEPEDIISLSNSSSMKKSTTSDDSLFFDQFNGGKSLNSALSIDNILSLSSFSSSSLTTNDNSSNEFNADFTNADIFVSPQLNAVATAAATSNDLISCSNNGHAKDDSDVLSTNSAHDTDYTTRNGTKSLINSTSTNDDSNSNSNSNSNSYSSDDKYAALKDLDLKFKQKQDQMQNNWNFSQNSTTLFSTAPTITSTIPSSFELSLNSNNISNICSDNKSKPKNPFWQEENNPFRATAQSNHFQQPINGFCDNFSDSNQVQSFLTYSQSLDFKSVTNPNPFNILHQNVDYAERKPYLNTSNGNQILTGGKITVKCKNFRIYNFEINSNENFNKVVEILNNLMNEIDDVSYRYAFVFKPTYHILENGYTMFKNSEEFAKLLATGEWRITLANSDYKLCATYSRELIVPAAVDDATIIASAQFRDGGRFPIMCYRHSNGAVLCRGSQPLVGAMKRSKPDEQLLNVMLTQEKGLILDTRSYNWASQCKSKGGGHEGESCYPQWKRSHCSFDKISCCSLMESLVKLVEACSDTNCTTEKWLSRLDNSGWLSHVLNLLNSACVAAQCIDKEFRSVFVHGSLGLDTTLIITSLTQIILNPDCRVIRGFQALIDREWIQAGYPFSTRHSTLAFGYGTNHNSKHKQSQPTFLLFLDCVYQLHTQYPFSFQFTIDFLVTLFEHSYSSNYGTFLGNNEAAREKLQINKKTTSLWSYINMPEVLNNYLNPLYEPKLTKFWPSVAPVSITLWSNLYFRDRIDDDYTNEIVNKIKSVIDHDNQLRLTVKKMQKQLIDLKKAVDDRKCNRDGVTPIVTK